MNSKAKTLAIATILFLLVVFAWQSMAGDAMTVNIDGDEVGGPLGALLGLMLAGGGLLIAVVAVSCAVLFVSLLCAGIGLVMISGLVLGAVVLVSAVSPLMLPLLIPVGLYWFFARRGRKQRRLAIEHAA